MTIEQLHKLFLESAGVSTDTRKIKKNQLFFALSGANFNGNNFAQLALDSGASFAIIDDAAYEVKNKTILVENCLKSLQNLAKYHRKFINKPIIALTGSNGKTTTKELINTVLSQKFKTIATQGNLNNHIGVPLTLLRLTKETEIGIIEMGANHLKEIENLCKIALPNYGYITNFGKAHLEGFGSKEGIIKGKSELYQHIIKTEGLLFVNQDDDQQVKLINHAETYSFGTAPDAHLKITYPPTQEFAQILAEDELIESSLMGAYNAINIAAAVAIGSYFKVSKNSIKQAIKNYIPANNRSQIINKHKLRILLDAYNANPTSMEVALSNFYNLKAARKIAILGDMFELGKVTQEEHQRILNLASRQNYDAVIAVGRHFNDAHLREHQGFYYFKDVEDVHHNLPQKLKKLIQQEVSVLIKGSRGMALERLVPFLEEIVQQH